MSYRLTLDLPEETRARWQLAADREGVGLVEWLTEVCDVASDPESGQVVDVALPAAVTEAA